MRITIDLGHVPLSMWLRPFLRALQETNEAWLRANPAAPSVYAAGVRYQAEPMGSEVWRTLPVILAEGNGDCEDLATARAAELRVAGERADAVAHEVPSGIPSVQLLHVTVRRGDGSSEDPSRRLGMVGAA